MSNNPNSITKRTHPYLPGLWLAAGFLALASLAFLLKPLGITPAVVTEKAAKVRLEKIAKLREEQNKLASSYGWVDQPKGIAHIPITKAMELIIPTLRANDPHPAYPITTIQPSAISAAGAPLYPEIPVAIVASTNAPAPQLTSPATSKPSMPTSTLPAFPSSPSTLTPTGAKKS